MTGTILVLNGPNLNLLGVREPEIYGRDTLDDIKKRCIEQGKKHGLEVDFRQSNSEATLIDWLHEARGTKLGVAINPGGIFVPFDRAARCPEDVRWTESRGAHHQHPQA